MDYHIKAYSECNAADPDAARTLQVMFRPGSTVTAGMTWEDVGFRHLNPDLIDQAKLFNKVTLLNPQTRETKVLKEHGKSIEPYYVD